MIDLILSSKTKLKLLRIFFSYPQREFSVTELLAEAKIGKGRITAELSDLVKASLLIHKSGGKLKLYTLNKTHPFFPELQALFEKEKRLTVPLDPQIRQLASELSIKLSKLSNSALIFGSVVSGTYIKTSDIDLLVISSNEKAVRKIIAELEGKYRVKFETIVLNRRESEKSKLLKSARRECIWLFGENAI